MIKKIVKFFSTKKESNMIHSVKFIGKIDPWIRKKVDSAKVLTLAELEEK